MSPGAKLKSWFSVRRWPWQTAVREDYERLALRVLGFVPELELALREARIGPHVRRMVFSHPVFETEGLVNDLEGTCPTLSFRVKDCEIITHQGTSFIPACADLKSGDVVKVYGVVQSKGNVRATFVQKH
jgi:hypothetical protein